MTVPRIAVIGAGIVGCAIALELRKRGADVTVVDRGDPGSGCSFGNSGAVSPGSVAPLAMPGVLSTLPQLLFDRDSPLYLPPSYLPRALPWLLRFVASARPASVQEASHKLAAVHRGALDAHEAMTRELGVPELFLRKGHLHLYPDETALAKDAGGWRLRKEHGWTFERLDRAGIESLEPNVHARYRIGIYMADHATILNPHRYVLAMARAFTGAGGRIVKAQVDGLQPQGSQWQLQGALANQVFDHVVVAAGAWSPRLLKTVGIPLNLESQRGYHTQFTGKSAIVSRTVILADKKVFVTPMEEGLRVGGTVEIGGLEAPPNERRAAALGRIARENFTGLDDAPTTHWMGHRPCMPDSIPVIGPAPGHKGLWIATGHGHLGLTDSLNTAQRIADGVLGTASASAPPAVHQSAAAVS
jgi:D-amino-acid dehydrogenase